MCSRQLGSSSSMHPVPVLPPPQRWARPRSPTRRPRSPISTCLRGSTRNACRRAASLRTRSPAAAVLRSAGQNGRPGDVVAAVTNVDAGRIVVLAIAATPDADELFFNAVTYAAGHLRHRREAARSTTPSDPAWQQLKMAVTELQTLQATDGSVPQEADHSAASSMVQSIIAAVTDIAPRFPHDSDYLAALVKDFTRWSGRRLCGPRLPGLADRVPPRDRSGRRP